MSDILDHAQITENLNFLIYVNIKANILLLFYRLKHFSIFSIIYFSKLNFFLIQ